jgi:hypothetical protein
VSGGVGYTSGDAAITFGNNGTGRSSLIINSVGFYLLCSAATVNVNLAPAAGSDALLSSQWLSGHTVAGSNIQSFNQVQGSITRTAVCGRATVLNANGTVQPLPWTGNTAIQQNSGTNASGNVWQFAVKLSGVSNAGGM